MCFSWRGWKRQGNRKRKYSGGGDKYSREVDGEGGKVEGTGRENTVEGGDKYSREVDGEGEKVEGTGRENTVEGIVRYRGEIRRYREEGGEEKARQRDRIRKWIGGER